MIVAGLGNLLEADVDALVNTVNTVGVMGKGIALQFRRAYPDMFRDYQRAARAGEVRLGSMHVWATRSLTGPRYIINFPTKGHWRSRSQLPDIESGLDDLVRLIGEKGITSVAVPPLGCGNGGLAWVDVEPRIRAKLGALADVDVVLFAPQAPPPASSMRTTAPRQPLTESRATLVALLDGYARRAIGGVSPIEVQKLTYFLQVAGQPLRLDFRKHLYGPYADNLRHVLIAMEGHHLTGYGDGSLPVADAEPLRLLPHAAEEAKDVLAASPAAKARVGQVLDLVEGFESPYSLELLASVHWLAEHDCRGTPDEHCIARSLQKWSPRKSRMFGLEHVRSALGVLVEQGWVASPHLSAT